MLTLGTCRKALWNYGSSVAYSVATAADLSSFDFKLNQVVERFFTLGTWRAMWKRPNLKVFSSTLTLPRGFDTCRAVRMCAGAAVPIYSAFHRFASQGQCWTDSFSVDGWLGGLTLSNESAQTFATPTGTFTLRTVTSAIVGTPPVMRLIGGFDEDDAEILDTITLDLSGTSETTQQYVKLPEIQKDVTQAAVLLYAVDVDTSVATLIATYAPGETIPSYRQYDVGCGLDDTIVTAICKLGFEPAISINDLVIPGNMGALKLGLQAREFEDKVDPVNAGLYWGPNNPERTGKMAGAIDLLDAEAAELDASEQPVFNVSPDYGAGAVVNVH